MKRAIDQLRHDFAAIVNNRNFITFDELTEAMGIPISKVLEMKREFEDQLRVDDNKIRITSRVDLKKPGFEIET